MSTIEERLRTGIAGDHPSDAIAGFVRRAVREGTADLLYAPVDTPVGRLLAVMSRVGLVQLRYADGDVDALLEEVAGAVSPRVLRDPDGLPSVRAELHAYFAGERRRFDLPIDWTLVRGEFARRVLEAARAIPYGQVASYRQVAEAAGNARASRAAGNALGANPLPIVVPCHRVVRTGGGLGGYTGGLERKRRLLALEGAA